MGGRESGREREREILTESIAIREHSMIGRNDGEKCDKAEEQWMRDAPREGQVPPGQGETRLLGTGQTE